MRILIRWAITAVAVFVAAQLVPGIELREGLASLLIVSAILGLVNAVLGTVLRILSIPLLILTLGLFAIVINMVVLWVTTIFTDRIDIEGFWAYFWAALIVSIVTLVLRICPTAATTDRPCGAARLEPGRLEACRRATGSVSAKT